MPQAARRKFLHPNLTTEKTKEHIFSEPFREVVYFENTELGNVTFKPASNILEPMQPKVTAKHLRDLENIAKILQYIEETHPTKQQLTAKFLKTTT